MTISRYERHVLKQFWATLRNYILPDLQNVLPRDKAKRTELALSRMYAGYELLPAIRTAHHAAYASVLAAAQTLARELAVAVRPSGHSATSGAGSPAFIGIPGVADELTDILTALVHATGGPGADARAKARVDQLLNQVVQVEARCRLDFEAQAAKLTPAGIEDAGAADRELTAANLQRYLQRHARGGAAVTVRKVTLVPGGRSKRTVIAELDNPGPLPREIVLRLDTGRGTGTSVADEYPMIARVATLDLPVPQPLWLETDTAVFGHHFIVFRRMPGASAGDLIEGAFRKEPATGRALARVLGQVHGAGVRLIEDPARRASSVADTRELLDHYLGYWNSKKPFASLVIDSAFLWLYRGLDERLGPATIVQADTGFHNLLLDEQGAGCLLDWEFAHFGDPAEDLASCRPAVEKCMPWADFMAEYQKHGGLPVSDFRLKYFEIWRPLRNAVACGTVHHSLMTAEADDIDPVTISMSTFVRLQADLARSLAAVTAEPA
jgi:aminoglycoside phosphotransferase (APT) family kinase protein